MNGTLNKVMLIGHLGDDVKLHYFEGGNCIGRFPLATNEVYINNLVVRNKAAEICEKYLSKGDKIYIEGRIKSRQWQAEDGTTKYTTEIQVTEFTFLTTKKELDAQGKQNFSAAVNEPQRTPSAAQQNIPAPDDDLPF